MIKGATTKADLSKSRAHWIDASTIAWDAETAPANSYLLHYAADGGIKLANNVVTGGASIPLIYDPSGLTPEQKALWPHLAAYKTFKIRAQDQGLISTILKGQFVVSAGTADFAKDASGVQLPGVLDDLYTYTGPLGATFTGGVPTVRVWAPTAKSVNLQVFADATSPALAVLPMTEGAEGVWSVTGDADWNGKYYLFEVEVYVPATGKVEKNLVTDPYSLALATNSTRSILVDLADPATKPAGWGTVAKPPLGAPEDIALYELHVRDFSVNDQSVPEAARGTFAAFTYDNSDGMKHLKSLQAAGLTHVHLLPAFDFATVNEDKTQRRAECARCARFGPSAGGGGGCGCHGWL
ncbi:MAG: hypothetical protein IPK16_17395 [Anaerolineales bacterium]|nr:hypothetical protein [Anaerolineales bacterium]